VIRVGGRRGERGGRLLWSGAWSFEVEKGGGNRDCMERYDVIGLLVLFGELHQEWEGKQVRRVRD